MKRTLMRPLAVAVGAVGVVVASPLAALAVPPNDVVKGPDLTKAAIDAPGATQIQELINYIGLYTLLAAMAGMLISLLILAIGPRLGFDRASQLGRMGLIVSLGVAFGVGIAAALINFFYKMGA